TTDLANPTVIRQLRSGNPGNSYAWTPRFHDITPLLGMQFRLRFTLAADEPLGDYVISEFQGWFLDDVRIATDGVVVQPPPGSRRPGLVRLPPPGGFLYLLMTGPVARIERSPDVNASGEINAFDLATLVQHFGSAAGGVNYNAACDLDDD